MIIKPCSYCGCDPEVYIKGDAKIILKNGKWHTVITHSHLKVIECNRCGNENAVYESNFPSNDNHIDSIVKTWNSCQDEIISGANKRQKLIDLLSGLSIDTEQDVEYVVDILLKSGVTISGEEVK